MAPWGLLGQGCSQVGQKWRAGSPAPQDGSVQGGSWDKQSGPPVPQRRARLWRVKGPGVRSLPELSLVVSSTAAVGYARDPGHFLVTSPWSLHMEPHWLRGREHESRPSLGSPAPEELEWLPSFSPDSHRTTASHRVSHLGTRRSPARELPHWPLCLPRPCPTCWGYDCPQMLGPEA